MVSKQNLHQSIKLLNLANQILKVLFIRDLFIFHPESKHFSVGFKNGYESNSFDYVILLVNKSCGGLYCI